MIRTTALFLAVLALADTAAAQLTEFEGRALTGAIFDRVYQDATVALAASDAGGAHSVPSHLPFGSWLTFTARSGGVWEVEFKAASFQSGESLLFGPTTGTLLFGFAADQSCRTVYAGTVSGGWIEWGSRGKLDAAGAKSSLVSCRVEASGAG